MKILIVALGSLGDAQPYLALGEGLQKDGQSVCIATNPNFASLVQAHDLRFAPLAGNTQDLMQDPAVKAALGTGNLLRQMQMLGAGLPPIPRPRLTAQKLAKAIPSLVGDESLRQRASELGERIRSEEGVKRVVELIRATYG
jgi:UDP:flavonoid glycosyltransferase YjiC (YdhE family)